MKQEGGFSGISAKFESRYATEKWCRKRSLLKELLGESLSSR